MIRKVLENLLASASLPDAHGSAELLLSRYHTLDGEVKSSSKRGFKLKREAQDWEQNELPKLIKELRAERTPNEKMTMKELIDDYIKDFKVSTRNSTAENKLHIINEKILPYFNKQKVFNIKPYDIKEWQNKIREMRKSNGEPYAPTYYYFFDGGGVYSVGNVWL